MCAGLAGFLADHGFDCWVLELRGHGQSERGHVNADFERFAMFDVPAGFQAVLRATGKEQVFLVAHSGGGLVFVMYLARNPEARERVRGLVTLASQATEAGATLRGRANATRIMLINNL
ncbi:MAG: esterase, partial [Candidatus Rokuibacteriota bacterium]